MTPNDRPGYVLGHSAEELQRLEQQGSFLKDSTRGVLFRAGLRAGMRVLDFGCGVGDVSFIAAELVGPTGQVLGVDRSAEAVELAHARAISKGLSHVTFSQSDEAGLGALAARKPFDAIVGRLVLIHQKDPIATIRQLVPLLAPGGVVAFHEIDLESGHWASPDSPALQQLWRWVGGLADRGLFVRDLATRMHDAFDRCGLVDHMVVREGRVVRNDDRAANAWLSGFVRSIATPVQQLGLGRADDLSVEHFAEHLARRPGFYVGAHMVAAHGRLPEAS